MDTIPHATYELSEAEKQLLLAVSALEKQEKETDKGAVAEYAAGYFGMYLADWAGACESLIHRGLLQLSADHYSVTPEGQPLADHYRAENPKYAYFYEEYYTRTQHSKAHAAFCERVYGKDLCQHGMMDMEQMGKLLDILALDADHHVLELGCGNGAVAEYISDVTMARITAVDTSAVAVAQAIARTGEKRSRLRFVHGDMLEVVFAPKTFDTIVAIDSLYFVHDLDRMISRLRNMAKPGAQMGVFWSSWVGEGESREPLLPHKNEFAETLQNQGLQYKTWDLTEQEVRHWTRKLRVASELKEAFEAEGNAFLYRKRHIEAEQHQPHVDAGRVSRYLYQAHL
jgi:cyclopropane fatty-acyl-phospholipid synthase-like methyltransferase